MFILKKLLVQCYEYFYEKRRLFRLHHKYPLNIMSPDKTLAYIKKHKCSIARFGDGEFDLILNERNPGFQEINSDLSAALIEVLKNKNNNLLLCVSGAIMSLKCCNDHSIEFWVEWGKNGHHEKIVNLLWDNSGKDYKFGDTLVTRPYIDYKTTQRRVKKHFEKLMQLWQNKDVLIVEGSNTCFGVGNDLFSNVKSIKRIIAPAVNAFNVYEEIKNKILDCFNGELVILALGPTATVLASDLSKKSIQSLDVGHVDIEYEWFLMGAKERVPIPGKFTNEAKNGVGRVFTECNDPVYLSQIIAKVGC